MSDNENSNPKPKGGKLVSWTDRDVLVCLLNVMEYSNVKLEYGDAPYPAGRNANGFRQKINALKRELQPEFASIKAGGSVNSTPKTQKGTPRKRKVKDEDSTNGENETPTKKRKKKSTAAEPMSATIVKDEPEDEFAVEYEL